MWFHFIVQQEVRTGLFPLMEWLVFLASTLSIRIIRASVKFSFPGKLTVTFEKTQLF